MKLKIVLFIIFNSLLYSQYTNLFNLNTNINNAKIIFSLNTNDNKLIVNADIPNNYYAYLKSPIANKIKFFADNEEINVAYPKGENYHNDIIIKGKQEFILNIDIKDIRFIKADYQLCSEKDNICLPPQSEIIYKIDEFLDVNASLIENEIKENKNILITLIIIFASGLASVLLPCSYPLLSITISIFANSKN